MCHFEVYNCVDVCYANLEKMSHRQFHHLFCRQLVEVFSPPRAAPQPPIPAAAVSPTDVPVARKPWKSPTHAVLYLQGRSRPKCVICKQPTPAYCEDCQLVLCSNQERNCFTV
jgi:hypothetical protein